MTSNENSDNSDFEPKNIFAAISQLGIGGEAPFLGGEFRGGQCQVYKLSFQNEDEESLAVRVPLHMNVGVGSQDEKIHALETELQNLQILERKGFRWAPRCRGHSLTFDNPVRYPFIVLTWIEGSKLAWDENFPQKPLRDRLLSQMASIQLSLIECTLEKGGPTTARVFFERILNNRSTRVQEGRLPGISEQDCIDQKALLDQILGTDRDSTAFAMDHGDLKPDNIIVDSEYNIKGVVDWAFAALVPIQRAAGLARFLWPDPAVSPTVQEDRQSYVASFASQSSQVASYMRRWQTTKDVDFRTLYLESLFSKGAHLLLARMGWKLPCCELLENEEDDTEDGGVIEMLVAGG